MTPPSPFTDVPTAIEEIRAGRMIVVIDDEDRENEGDLTLAAEKVTPEAINYHEPGADFYVRRESPAQRQAFLERQLQKLHPGCTIAITISPPEAAFTPGA